MSDGKCTKCGSSTIHLFTGTGSEFSIPLGIFNAASVVYHICVSCGAVELKVADKKDLPKIEQKYPKVG